MIDKFLKSFAYKLFKRQDEKFLVYILVNPLTLNSNVSRLLSHMSTEETSAHFDDAV